VKVTHFLVSLERFWIVRRSVAAINSSKLPERAGMASEVTPYPASNGALAPQILNYVVAAVGTSFIVFVTWLPIKLVDLFRPH
jgi:hypothetical protein